MDTIHYPVCYLLGCSLQGERARSSNHKTSLITVRLSLLLHLLNFLVLPLILLLPLANIARHRLLKMNYIFTSTYGPSTSTLIRLYKSYTRSLFDYGAPATCVAPPHVQRIWEGVQTHFIT